MNLSFRPALVLLALPSAAALASTATQPPARIPGPVSPSVDSRSIRFEYWDYKGDQGTYRCAHKKANVGLYEWDVVCPVNGVDHKFNVHLVVNLYPQTRLGKNAYEILYWVTDFTNARKAVESGTSLWVHHTDKSAAASAVELSQSVEDFNAALRLTLVGRGASAGDAFRGHRGRR